MDNFWVLKMADNGVVSDGSDIDYEGSEVGGNVGSTSRSISSESDLEERRDVPVQSVVQSDDSDDSDFLGFQNTWVERDFARRVTMAFRGVGGSDVLHPPEANPGMYFDQLWTAEMWTQLTDETNRYTARERQQHPPPASAPIWTSVTVEDMRAFVGLCFAMGVLRLPSRNDYWRGSNWLLKTNFGRVMPRDTFKGSFKCYVTLEGVGGYMPKRYEALRGGGGGGVTSALRNVFFFLANSKHCLVSSRPTRILTYNNLASISNNMFLCIMFTT